MGYDFEQYAADEKYAGNRDEPTQMLTTYK
jgi:hypothetical protein